jgi:hypothetical protein
MKALLDTGQSVHIVNDDMRAMLCDYLLTSLVIAVAKTLMSRHKMMIFLTDNLCIKLLYKTLKSSLKIVVLLSPTRRAGF